jgi:acetylornithine deacetylase
MPVDRNILEDALQAHLGDAVAFLCDIIRYPSVRGQEGPVMRAIHECLRPYCSRADLVQIPQSFTEDPEYRWPLQGLSYAETQNLRLTLDATDPSARTLLLNAHADVVPPSPNQPHAYDPEVRNDTVFGRGACDDKGQIAVIYLVLRTLASLGLRPRGRVTCDIVIEEENGGNGTLFMTRHPVSADVALVLEPSSKQVFVNVRGAVWFELVVAGRAGHSGSAGGVVSALKETIKGMVVLEQLHDRILAAARGKFPLFDVYENPMPITFGELHAGVWPSIVPALASVKGVFGFLPDMTYRTVQEAMISAIRNSPHEYLREHFTLTFNMLNSNGNVLNADHPFVRELAGAAAEAGSPMAIAAMTASCDAWQYSSKFGIPTVVMGVGSLAYAHSNEEQVPVQDIHDVAKTMILFMERWCGLEDTSKQK